MESDFFAYMYRLRYIKRWSLMRNTVRENVAEHSYHVALLTHMLCSIANTVYGRDINGDKAVSMALFHDATESFTGDLPTPIKHHNPEMLRSFREIERLAADKLAHMVPAELLPVYTPLLSHSDSDPLLWQFVKAADLIDAYLKCVTELAAGNREFGTAKKQTEEALLKLGMPEVDYFLTNFAPSVEKTLDELSEDV